MFVWIFHRVSGVILIVLIGFKIFTGYGILGRFGVNVIEIMRALHRSLALDLSLVFLFIFHALYGIRTCLIDLGFRGERIMFWMLTVLGVILFFLLASLVILPHFRF